MNINYITAAILIADHGYNCGCTHCQQNNRILQLDVSAETKKIAHLASKPLWAQRQQEADDRADADIIRYMTDADYERYLRGKQAVTTKLIDK